LENSTLKKLTRYVRFLMAGCAFGYPTVDGRLQRKPTPQILFIGVFSTNGSAVFRIYT